MATAPKRKRAKRIAGISRAAAALGVCRQHLQLVLTGGRESQPLLARYRAWRAIETARMVPDLQDGDSLSPVKAKIEFDRRVKALERGGVESLLCIPTAMKLWPRLLERAPATKPEPISPSRARALKKQQRELRAALQPSVEHQAASITDYAALQQKVASTKS